MRLLTVHLPLRPTAPSAQWASLGVWRDLAFQLHEGVANAWVSIQAGRADVERLPAADRLRLIVPACDVRLLTVKLPPMSVSKLQLALPHAVEDQLLQDPLQCHLAISNANTSGEQSVAVIDRSWMRALVERFQPREGDEHAPASHYAQMHIIPAQLDLPWPPSDADAQMVGVEENVPANAHHPGYTLRTIRTGPFSGYGLRLANAAANPADASQLAWPAHTQQLSPETLAAERPALESPLNLCQFEFANVAQTSTWLNWHTWRWPLRLLAVIVVLQGGYTLGQTWVLQREANQLRDKMAETLHSVLPNEPNVDAPLQLRRHVEQLRSAGGKLSADDFNVVAERLAKLLQGQAPDLLQSMQYQQRGLTIQLKAGANTSALSDKAAQFGLRLQAEGVPNGGPSRWRVTAQP